MSYVLFLQKDLFFLTTMKIITNRFFVAIIYLLGISTAFAQNPPVPSNGVPPPPPAPPIDENLFVLLIMALFLGVYTIYKHQKKTKIPI
jgi:hypothetical protein